MYRFGEIKNTFREYPWHAVRVLWTSGAYRNSIADTTVSVLTFYVDRYIPAAERVLSVLMSVRIT